MQSRFFRIKYIKKSFHCKMKASIVSLFVSMLLANPVPPPSSSSYGYPMPIDDDLSTVSMTPLLPSTSVDEPERVCCLSRCCMRICCFFQAQSHYVPETTIQFTNEYDLSLNDDDNLNQDNILETGGVVPKEVDVMSSAESVAMTLARETESVMHRIHEAKEDKRMEDLNDARDELYRIVRGAANLQ